MQKVKVFLAVIGLAGAILLFSCKKHHTNPTSAPQTNPWDETEYWNAVVGHYKVYDSIGDFVYEMDISHIVDSTGSFAKFENFDGEFTFTAVRSYYYPQYVNFGSHDTLYDLDHKRWKLGEVADTYFNNIHGDTLPLYFHITNINYWLQDATPYYAAVIKQTAIKQH